MVVLVRAARIRVAFEMSSNLFYGMFGGGIWGSGSDGRDINLVVTVVVVMVQYWWSSDGDWGDDGCWKGDNCD